MKLTKLFVLFAILPIVSLLGKEQVAAVFENDKLQKEDLDIDGRIKKLLRKKKLIKISLIAAMVLAAGGILGGLGYGIVRYRKKGEMDSDDEPFVELVDPVQGSPEATHSRMTSTTGDPQVTVTIERSYTEVPPSPADLEMEDIDGDTGQGVDPFVDETGQDAAEEIPDEIGEEAVE
ncbi:hypothetical protein C922_04677 [Plasmodium inui San Antonio 1]|uniref:Early transcribed membrane protein n=1 Tax=Plasmodium inui San Antonio 1 TaxID=1237626 RepID=W7A056_9APIC|nr:hypothetical protein C922_04677 [Plasmodium inui San Antonio 1]EUD64945.1 hypothetical protein C922_04677 [Plasmodium inui San Antonio 1]